MRTVAVALVTCASLLAGVPAAAQLRSQVVASGLVQPLAFVQDPSNPTVQYIVEQGGRILVLQAGVLQTAPFLDLSAATVAGGEGGLLGLAFPPDYGSSGRFYVNFTNVNGDTVIARFRRSAGNPLLADSSSRFDLQWPTGERFIVQPFSNHNGGNLVFGPDGFLYIGMGDGGSGNDPGHFAQNPGSLLGKMLRIDVSVADGDLRGYRLPPDNPFVSGGPVAALGEIWAFGLRNPWRFAFDDPARGGTGALIIADVGQRAWEEINYEPAGRGGRNYGWRNREGAHDNVTTAPPAYMPLWNPIFEYDRTVGQSITGGFVYRGTALGPDFFGRYFFADFVVGRVWSLGLGIDPATGEAMALDLVEHTADLGGSAALGSISSMGLDASGELYVVNWSAGRILRVVSAAPSAMPLMHIDTPTAGAMVAQPFAVAGWAIDPAAATGTGVDVVNVWAYPGPGSGAQPIFVGAAVSGGSRPDVGAAFGSRFASSGFSVLVSGLAPGDYQLVAFALSTATGTFNNSKAAIVTVRSDSQIPVDSAVDRSTLAQPFVVTGSALDMATEGGTGVNVVHVWPHPSPGPGAPPVFFGETGYGAAQPDVAAFGNLRMAIDLPSDGESFAASQPFAVEGWALDMAAPSGTGVDAIHVWAYPNPGSGMPPVFLGEAGYGRARPDVGAVFGGRFALSGYGLVVAGLGPGSYQVVAFAYSAVTGTFTNARAVNVNVQ
jgi:glucose/arabinose dehydrogenase